MQFRLLTFVSLTLFSSFLFSDHRKFLRKRAGQSESKKSNFSLKIPIKIPFKDPFSNIFHKSPQNLRLFDLTGRTDRDGIIHLKWDAFEVNGSRAKKYQIVILGRPNFLVNSGGSLEQDYLLDPVDVFDSGVSDTVMASIDLRALWGRDFENDKGRFGNLAKNMFRGKQTNIYFAVRGTNTKDFKNPYVYIPDFDENHRQKRSSNGKYKVKKEPNYTFKGTYFSSTVGVSVKIDKAPVRLKLSLLERKILNNQKGQFCFGPKSSLNSLTVTVGDSGNPRKLSLEKDAKIEAIYEDNDGILDLSWMSENGKIPHYPLYQIQVSKWPKFTMNPNTDFDKRVVDRYFRPGEKTHFLYNNYDDFVEALSYRGKKTFDSPFYFKNKQIVRPFFSKNLSITGFAKKDKHFDYGKPIYFKNDNYGFRDGVYYLRIRALGRENASKSANSDDVYGPWSRIVAVKVQRKKSLIPVYFKENPQSIDRKIVKNKGYSILDQGCIPVNFELKNGLAPFTQKDNIYQIAVSKNPKLIVNRRYIEAKYKEGREKDYFFEYVLASKMSSFSSDPRIDHKIDLLFDVKNPSKMKGRYYLWIRTVRNSADSLPSFWSQPVSVNVDHIKRKKALQPDLKKIDPTLCDLEKGVVALDWTLKGGASSDPRNALYTDRQDGKNTDFIPFYNVIVYKKELSPVDDQGRLLFEDKNDNEINDWIEIDRGGGFGKAYAVYMVRASELRTKKATAPLYRLNLLTVYDVFRDSDGTPFLDENNKFLIKQKGQSLEEGRYFFYVFSTNLSGKISLLSQKRSIDLPSVKYLEPPVPILEFIDKQNPTVKANLENGVVPLRWSLDADPSDPFALSYIDSKKLTHIPAYYLLVIKGNADPIDPMTGLLKFEDKNHNDKNDWLEMQHFDEKGLVISDENRVGKAYSSRFIGVQEMISQRKADKTFFHMDLHMRSFDRAQIGEGDDNSVEKVFSGVYHFYLFSTNKYDNWSRLTSSQSVVLPDIHRSRPPRPKLHSIESKAPSVQDGVVPLSWTFEKKPQNPRNGAYGNKYIKKDGLLVLNPLYVDHYEILVLKKLLSDSAKEEGPVDKDGELLFFDDNKNYRNDWLEMGTKKAGLCVYAKQNVWDLLPKTSSSSKCDILTKFYLHKVFGKEGVYSRKVSKGTYLFYLWSVSALGKKSLVSQPQSLVLDKDIYPALLPPRPVVHPLDLSQKDLLSGKIPLSWTLEAEPSDPRSSVYTEKTVQKDEKSSRNDSYIPSYCLLVFKTDLDESLDGERIVFQSKVLNEDSFSTVVDDPSRLIADLKKRAYLSKEGVPTMFFSNSAHLKIFEIDPIFAKKKRDIFQKLQCSLLQMNFVDKNNKGRNDFLELGAKLYAEYMILEKDLLPKGKKDLLYRVRLFEKFRPVKMLSESGIRTEYRREISPILKGRYHCVLCSTNRFGEKSVVSSPRSFDVKQDIMFSYPLTPHLKKPTEFDQGSLHFQREGLIPVSWTLGDKESSPIDLSLTNPEDPNAILFYRILFYKNVRSETLVDDRGFIKWNDANNNGENDWNELFRSGKDNELITNFYVTTQDLRNLAKQELNKPKNKGKKLTEMPCCYKAPLTVAYQIKHDAEGNPVLAKEGGFSYEPTYHEISKGEYTVFVLSVNKNNIESPLSEGKTIVIEKDIPLKDIPRKILLDPITPNPDKNAVVGLNWRISKDKNIQDDLNWYEGYEVNISKRNSHWNDGEYTSEFVQTLGGDHPLMIFSPEKDRYVKVGSCPWIKNLRDPLEPLISLKKKTNSLLREDGSKVLYYFRVRALLKRGSFWASGEWSNTESVLVLNNIPKYSVGPLVKKIFPRAKKDISEFERGEIIPMGSLKGQSSFSIYYEVTKETFQDNVSILEIQESDTLSFSRITQKFYLDTHSLNRGLGVKDRHIFAFKRSLFHKNDISSEWLLLDDKNFYGQTRYYRAKSLAIRNGTPDRLNDSHGSFFSQIVRVDIPLISDLKDSSQKKSPLKKIKTWRR